MIAQGLAWPGDAMGFASGTERRPEHRGSFPRASRATPRTAHIAAASLRDGSPSANPIT